MKLPVIPTTMSLSLLFSITTFVSAIEYPFDYNGTHYIIEKTGKTWANAKTATASHAAYNGMSGMLAIIDSAGENMAVYNALISAGVSTTSSDGGGARYAWLGGTDNSSGYNAASEGNFYWINGIKFWTGGYGGHAIPGVYTKFGTLEPDNYNGNQHYLAMGLQSWPLGDGSCGSASQWNDLAGINNLAYVIEFSIPVPEPATVLQLGFAAMLFGLAGIRRFRRKIEHQYKNQ